MKNAIGREGLDRPYQGAFANEKEGIYDRTKNVTTQFGRTLDEALDACDLKDGITVSFHHHLRNGDFVLDRVMRNLHKRGIKEITVAASSLFPCHNYLTTMIEDGSVTKIYASYISGPIAKAISYGKLKETCVLTTHGGRPRMILEGVLPIDIAFVAAPGVDEAGNITGSDGPSACGSLGYAVADAQMAKKTIAITDYIAPEVNRPEIDHRFVDEVVLIDQIGDPSGIVSGTTQITKDPVGLKIARDCTELIEHTGLLKEGFSFQTGAGGVSLAVADYLKEVLKEKGLSGRFASGGITDYLAEMLAEGYFEKLYDVQCFNLGAVESIRKNPNHIKIDANTYANIDNPKHNIVNQLDIVILGCSEIDLDFNVNVTTGSDGVILGGSSGHADTSAGAKLSIIVSKLVNARISCLVDQVTTVTTPGETVDILVTERGIAINPKHPELVERLKSETNLNIVTIEELKGIADKLTGTPKKRIRGTEVVAISEYRDGTVLDVLYKVEEN